MAETLRRLFHRRSASTPQPKNPSSDRARPVSRASSFFGLGGERAASRADLTRSFGRNRSRTSFFQPEDPADHYSSPYAASKPGPAPEFGDRPAQGNGRTSFAKSRSSTVSTVSTAPPRLPHPILEEENGQSLEDALGLSMRLRMRLAATDQLIGVQTCQILHPQRK